jgi:hypothetical protein
VGKQRRTKAMSSYIIETLNGKWFGRTELKLQFNKRELPILLGYLRSGMTGLDFNVEDDILIIRTEYWSSPEEIVADLESGVRHVTKITNSPEFQHDIAIIKTMDSKLAEHILSFHGRMK